MEVDIIFTHHKLLILLGQWLRFKLFGITYLVGKIKFNLYLGGGFKYLHVYHYLGKMSNLTNIFQMAVFQGWYPVVDKNTHNFHHGAPHIRTTPTSKGQ